jgi:hypothetical protein
VNRSLDKFDTGAARANAARLASQDAGSAFGARSRTGNAIFQGDTVNNRGLLASNLYSNAFNTAAGYGMQDANRSLSADTSNAGNRLNAALANQSTAFNTGNANANLLQNNNQFNANLGQTANVFNAGANNQFSLANQASSNAADSLHLNALNSGNAAQISKLGLMNDVGTRIDDRNQAVLQEPLNLQQQYWAMLNGIPYDTTSTETGTSTTRGKTFNYGANFKG